MGLGAVLFDMDGTLVDTEKVWEVALHELAAHFGATLSAPARAAMVGGSSASTMRLLSVDLNRPDIDHAAGAAWLEARMIELFGGGVLPWRDGAQSLLAEVRAAGITTALVTNTNRPLVTQALRTIGADNFDVVVCGDEVAFTKPHPEHYLAAAVALGVSPATCVAIEDSPTGIASARSAGCAVLAIPNEVALTDDDRRGVTVRPSLLEVDLPLLRALVS